MVDAKNQKEQKEKIEKCNKYFGPALFNLTWDLIEKGEKRTPEDELMMIHTAHASAWHWRQVGTPLNFARSQWQLSRVYSILGRTKEAMYHAELSLELCKDNGIGGFDLAFAYEALARASSTVNALETTERYLKLARKASDDIAKKGDRDYFLSELETIKL